MLLYREQDKSTKMAAAGWTSASSKAEPNTWTEL